MIPRMGSYHKYRKSIQKNMIKVYIMAIFYEQLNISIEFYSTICNFNRNKFVYPLFAIMLLLWTF